MAEGTGRAQPPGGGVTMADLTVAVRMAARDGLQTPLQAAVAQLASLRQHHLESIADTMARLIPKNPLAELMAQLDSPLEGAIEALREAIANRPPTDDADDTEAEAPA